MKVKEQKTDELVVALKQLKLTDRHSSFSIHNRMPRTCLSRLANEHSLRIRLTRSLSAVAPCLHHHELDNSRCSFTSMSDTNNFAKRLTESMIDHSTTVQSSPFSIVDSSNPVTASASNNSPFILSVGRLHSTLNIDTVNQERSPSSITNNNRASSALRRSISTDLDQLYHQSNSKDLTLFAKPFGNSYINVTASNQSQMTKHTGFSATGISSHSKLFSHHCSTHSGCSIAGVNRVTLPQLHLFRRLYSLIDHPCINLYHTCRYSSCSHMTLTSEWATASTPRRVRQQNSRHRYSLGSSGSVTNLFSMTATTTTTNQSDNSTASYSGLPLGGGISSGFHWPFALQSTNPEVTAIHPNNHNHSACSTPLGRCRRNSDPEHWQQQVQQTNLKQSALEESVLKCPGIYQGPQRTGRFSRSGPVSQKSTAIHPSPSSPRPSPSLFSKSSFLPVRRLTQDVVRSVSDSGESSQLNAPALLGFTQKNAPSTFRFRAPILPCRFNTKTEELVLQGGGDCSTTRSDTGQRQPERSTHDTLSFWSLSEPRHINTSGKAINQKIDVGNDSEVRHHSGTHGVTDSGETLPFRHCDSKLGSASKELFQQSTCEDSSGEAGEQSATMVSMMMTSDVSVSELAGYMEHMVHIPGHMSEMAQRMYI